MGKLNGPYQCIEKCREKGGSGVTIDSKTEKSCYCEFGTTGHTQYVGWKMCIFSTTGILKAIFCMNNIKLNNLVFDPFTQRYLVSR